MKLYFDYKKYNRIFTADFETSTAKWNIDRARVWLWDICTQDYRHANGNSIESFLDTISQFNNCVFSFHNLAYDGSYILDYLLRNGYEYSKTNNLKPKQFTTIITPQNVHYAYAICFENYNQVVINDSFKHNSQSVDTLAKTYNLPINKLKIDYDELREIGHKPTELELQYIHHDTEIVMRVLNEDFKHGFTKFTESGNSRKFFKATHKKEYDILFPELSDGEDAFIRRSYRGGYCWLKPECKNKVINSAISIDINSMYPAQMLHELLPYGEGIWVDGFCENYRFYNPEKMVYVQRLTCEFKLKENRPPTIAKKHAGRFSISDLYLSSSENQLIDMCLTSVDLKLLFECYYVYNLTYIGGYIYNAVKGYEATPDDVEKLTKDEVIELDGKGSLYYDYLYPWRMQKEHETGGKRDRAKKMQNIAYGSQATSKNGDLAQPYISIRNTLSYSRYSSEKRKGGYIPISTFITAWSRKLLIETIIKNYDRFIYCDTDSCYLIGNDLPDTKIHDTLYGYFKVEHIITKAKFLGCKRYVYFTANNSPKDPNEFVVTCCGAPKEVKEKMTFDNFVPYNEKTKEGEFTGKLKANVVEGGKHIIETTYRLIV